jgi:hypothetical protein
MDNLITKYRNWAMDIPEHVGELLAIGLYLSFMTTLSGAVFSLAAGAYMPAAACTAGLLVVSSIVFIP